MDFVPIKGIVAGALAGAAAILFHLRRRGNTEDAFESDGV
jgi:hypothetical protein